MRQIKRKEGDSIVIFETLIISRTQTLTIQVLAVINTDNAQAKTIIEAGAEVSQFMQTIKFRGRTK